jgi:hypothetical protein
MCHERKIRVCLLLLGVWGVLAPISLAQNTDPPEPKWTDAQRSHWSFVPPVRPQVPNVKNAGWVKNPIDAFILGSLEDASLPPAREADRVTLIRRVTFDLTGLPPTAAELDQFVNDKSPTAYEKLVDRLLASPAFGERQARAWLDLARFAESDGFKSDKTRPNAWRYRDWVIKALNADLPYDKFVALQLAGDEIASGDPDAFIATGFNRNYPFEDNNMVPGLNQQLMLDDMTDTTSAVFMGLTVACARCHNHKYDPISQKDYYRIQAAFGATTPSDNFTLGSPFERAMFASIDAEHKARVKAVKTEIDRIESPYKAKLLGATLAKLPPEVLKAVETDPEKRTALQEDLIRSHSKKMAVDPKAMQSAMKPADRTIWTARTALMASLNKSGPPPVDSASGMTDTGPKAPPVYLRRKGNFKNPGGAVDPGGLSILSTAAPMPETEGNSKTSGRRKALALWLTRPDHPLTARVLVNRLWQGHFGRGIVATASDFGTQGAEPTHPELLDWLATELIANGWSMKAMHRLMVTSATYRQSSTPPEASLAGDPENSQFGRMPRHRLEAEAVRDSLLAVAGQLDQRIGGPSVFPDLPPGIDTRGGWTRSESESDRNRRSIYVFVRRNLKYPLFDAFDVPDTNTTCPDRNVSVNAPQALMLLNSDIVLDLARSMAGRIYRETSDRNDQAVLVSTAYRLAFSRQPDAQELKSGIAFLESQPAHLSGQTKLKTPKELPDGVVPAQAAALVDYCHVLLNLNEFVFID